MRKSERRAPAAVLLALLFCFSACGGQAQSGGMPTPQGTVPASVPPAESPAQDPDYTAVDMQGIDPYDPNLNIQEVDFSRQPAFTSTEGMDGYFRSCIEARCRSIAFSCSRDLVLGLEAEDFCNTYHVAWMVTKLQPGEYGKHYILRVTYYPGDNVAWAYLNGDTGALVEEELALYDAAVAWMEAYISPEMTDYEKCVAIHDYLAGHVQYDNELLAALNTSFSFDWGITAYGALIGNNSICQGYADAFDMLASMLGFDCTQIYGMGSGVPHNWNLLELDGQWYHVDCTFDDKFPNNDGSCAGVYLFASDAQMRRTHSWDASRYPEAADDSLWYYSVAGRTVGNEAELEARVAQPLREGEVVSAYIRNLTKKQVADLALSLGAEFYTAEYQSDLLLYAWTP